MYYGQNLTPEQLQQILALRTGDPSFDNGQTGRTWYDPRLKTDDPNAYMLFEDYGYRDNPTSPEQGLLRDAALDKTVIRKLRPDTGGKLGDMWDDKGNYLGTYEAQDAGGRQFNTAALMFGGALGSHYLQGLNEANSVSNAANAGGTTMSAAEQAAFLEANMGAGAPMAGMPGSAWYNALQPYVGTDLANMAYQGVNSLSTLGIPNSPTPPTGSGPSGSGTPTPGQVGSTVSTLSNVANGLGSTGQLIGAGLGAVAGAIDSKDKEQTATRDPWSKAQPFLEQLLGQGQQLATRYQQQPFSPAQQQAYANMGGLLGGINQSMPGLLSQMSSQQQFVRGGQPTRTQGVNLQWQPGLLGNYGT